MAPRKAAAPKKTAAKTAAVVEEDTDVVEEDTVEEATPEPLPVVEAVTAEPATKSARVKGTWTMYWGTLVFDFVDGERYELPLDLFNYLRNAGNIYDTL
jgi:hypothetical protein